MAEQTNGVLTVAFPSDDNYIFEDRKTTIPHFLAPVAPLELRNAITQAHRAASAALKELKRLEKNHSFRLHRLCPVQDVLVFRKHCCSVDRLLEWVDDTHIFGNPTLAKTPKIPQFLLFFHVDEHAFRAYQAEFEEGRTKFLNGTYLAWRQGKRRFQEVLRRSGIPMIDMNLCWEWWNGFLREMEGWEKNAELLETPGFASSVGELAALIEDKADLEDKWKMDF